MTISYHVRPPHPLYTGFDDRLKGLSDDEGTKLEQPFEYVNGLLVRPSDFSVTRVTSVDGSDNFWWNFMSRPNAADYNPTRILQNLLAEWVGQTSGSPAARAPFITALIHENNFCRNGAEGWTNIYFTMNGAKRGAPLPAPWNLNAPDPSKPRTEADQSAIWAAYEELVAYAAANLTVVTSEDIVNLAQQKP